MRILDRPAVARQPRPDLARRAFEFQNDQSRVIQKASHDGSAQRAECEPVATPHRRRQWPVLRAHAKVAEAKQHCGKALHLIGGEGIAAGQTRLDLAAARQMSP